MEHADGDAVGIIDPDRQNPLEVIPWLVERWRTGHEGSHFIGRICEEGKKAASVPRQGEDWSLNATPR
jgi:hypothetical protein